MFGSDDDDDDLGVPSSKATSVNGSQVSSVNYDNLASSQSQNESTLDDIFGEHDRKLKSSSKPRSSSKLCLIDPHSFANSTAHYLRTPNFMKIQPTPFDRASHDVEAEKRSFGKATAVIRWRYRRDSSGSVMKDAEGNPLRESNARLVKWSDGSYQVVVGTEIFRVETPSLQNW